jgi:hypothetical protein
MKYELKLSTAAVFTFDSARTVCMERDLFMASWLNTYSVAIEELISGSRNFITS